MTTTCVSHIQQVRFPGDEQGAAAIMADEELWTIMEPYSNSQSQGSARKDLLGSALRVDGGICPELGQALAELRQRAGMDEEMECYVYECPVIEAGVLKNRDRYIVVLSSTAIEKLDPVELEFVIGHELGHVVYDHFKIPVSEVLQSDSRIQSKHAMKLLSWQRNAEISADRAGLLCCGSLEAASQAFFKLLSGLSFTRTKIDPVRFADQFDHLRKEIFREGAEEMWTMSHPLSPLRMKALDIFWKSDAASAVLNHAKGGRRTEACDREIAQLLSFMDPLQTKQNGDVDLRIQPFLTWGGLYVAARERQLEASQLAALAEIVGEHDVEDAVKSSLDADYYFQQFQAARQERTRPLNALDINRVFSCLVKVARADGAVDPNEVRSMHDIAQQFGIAESYVDALVADFES